MHAEIYEKMDSLDFYNITGIIITRKDRKIFSTIRRRRGKLFSFSSFTHLVQYFSRPIYSLKKIGTIETFFPANHSDLEIGNRTEPSLMNTGHDCSSNMTAVVRTMALLKQVITTRPQRHHLVYSRNILIICPRKSRVRLESITSDKQF